MKKKEVLNNIFNDDNFGLTYVFPKNLNLTWIGNRYKEDKEREKSKKELFEFVDSIETYKPEKKINEFYSKYDEITSQNPLDFVFKYYITSLFCARLKNSKYSDGAIDFFTEVKNEILAYVESELKKSPLNEDLLFEKGQIYHQYFKDYESAIKIFDKLIEMNPAYALYHYQLYLIKQALKDPHGALDSLKKYQELSGEKNDSDIIRYIGHLKKEIKDETFINDYLKSVELDQSEHWVLMVIAMYYLEEKNNINESIKMIDKYLSYKNSFVREKMYSSRKKYYKARSRNYSMIFSFLELKKIKEAKIFYNKLLDEYNFYAEQECPLEPPFLFLGEYIKKIENYLTDEEIIEENESLFKTLKEKNKNIFKYKGGPKGRGSVLLRYHEKRLIEWFLKKFDYNLQLASKIFQRPQKQIFRSIIKNSDLRQIKQIIKDVSM